MIQIAYYESDSPKVTIDAATTIMECSRINGSEKEFASIVTDIDEPDYVDGTITMHDTTHVTTRTAYFAHLDQYIPA